MENVPPNGPAAAAPAAAKSKSYRNQALRLLQNEFRGLSCAAIKLVFDRSHFDYAASQATLTDVRPGDDATVEAVAAFRDRPANLKIFIKTERKARDVAVTNQQLQEEMGEMPEFLQKQPAGDGGAAAVESIELLSDSEAEEEPGELECGCCFGDYPPNEMDQCTAGRDHLCCKGCIRRYVSEQLDGNNNVHFSCIVDADCQGVYGVRQLDQLLTPRISRRVNDRRIRAEIETCGMRAWTCDKCGHIGVLDEPLPITIHCPDCNIVYCRTCKHPHHEGMTCEQLRAQTERLKDPVVRAQEAMSQATIRVCPACALPFQKRDGCNKIKCKGRNCKALICYLCRKQIKDYDHFCRKVGCRCGRLCHLWESPEEADRKARHDAGRKVLAEANMDAADIERLLASPPPAGNGKRRTQPRARAAARGNAGAPIHRAQARAQPGREQHRVAEGEPANRPIGNLRNRQGQQRAPAPVQPVNRPAPGRIEGRRRRQVDRAQQQGQGQVQQHGAGGGRQVQEPALPPIAHAARRALRAAAGFLVFSLRGVGNILLGIGAIGVLGIAVGIWDKVKQSS